MASGRARSGRPAGRVTPKTQGSPPGRGAPAGGPVSLVRGIIDPRRAFGVAAAGQRQWGLVDVVAWFLVGQALTIPIALLVMERGGYATAAEVPLWLSQGVVVVPLWAALVGGSIWATTRKGAGARTELKLHVRPVDIPLGVAVGLGAQLVLNPLLYRILFVFTGELDVSERARSLSEKATSPALVVLLFVTVGFVAPLAEELFFRGLALQALVRLVGPVAGLLVSSVFFALVHFNLVHVVALLPLALILSWLVLRFDRLGPAIAAHMTYNLVTAAVLVFDVQVPW